METNDYVATDNEDASPFWLPVPPESFDWRYYVDTYMDLQMAGILDEAAAWRHYNAHGRAEGRATHAPNNT